MPLTGGDRAEAAVEADGIAKRYVRDQREAQRSGVTALWRELRTPPVDALCGSEFWALRDVSFTIGRGEALGLLGRNGAGKSTLLRIVSGITRPSAGTVVRRGTVASLLDVNAGFNPVLSGRENVEVAYTLLRGNRPGRRLVDDIARYAGVVEAIDDPVRAYSQGMRMRLGFALVVHVDPDVLVVDEALAVGDSAFQVQCLEHLHTFRRAGGALLFTSHSLWVFQHLATAGIHLAGGEVVLADAPEAVADSYLGEIEGVAHAEHGDGPDPIQRERVIRRSVGVDAEDERPPALQRPVRFTSIEVDGDGGPPTQHAPATVRLHIESEEAFEAEVGFMVWTADLSVCVAADLSTSGIAGAAETFALRPGGSTVTVALEDLPLAPGHYAVRAAVYDAPTGDIMGLAGIEDTPTWFVVEGPEVPHHETTALMRPLRTVAVEDLSVRPATGPS